MDRFNSRDDGAIELNRDMAGSHDDFLRLLPRAAQDRPYTVSGTQVEILPADGMRIAISLGPQGMRRIGPTVALPLTPVRYVFQGMNAQQIETFLTGFDRYYQRGGG